MPRSIASENVVLERSCLLEVMLEVAHAIAEQIGIEKSNHRKCLPEEKA